MFGFFKNKKKEVEEKKGSFSLVAIADGILKPLSEVPDPVFSQKMTGDGVAIEPTGDIIVAPADGELTMVFPSKHAFGMTLENGIELLIHVGLETVSLNGEGFELLEEAGAKVKAGTPILKIDREFIKSKGLPLITPVLITNPEKTSSMEAKDSQNVEKGQSVILEYTL